MQYNSEFEQLKEQHEEAKAQLEQLENADANAIEYYNTERVMAKMWIQGKDYYGMTYPELLEMSKDPELLANDEEYERYNLWRVSNN